MARSPTSTRSPRAPNQMMDIAWRMSAHCGAAELASVAGISRSAAARVVAVRRYTTASMIPGGALLAARPWLVAYKAAAEHARAAGVVFHWARPEVPVVPAPTPRRQLLLVPEGGATPPVPFTEKPVKAQAEPLSMSSLEIAELTGKRHANVMRDIRDMLTALDPSGFTGLKTESSYTDTTGRKLLMFNLPKDLTLTLVSGYNVQMRHRIITRWLELEEANKPAQVAAPRTLSEALFLAATLAAEAEQRRVAA